MKTAHEIWSYLNEKYATVSDDDDEPKKEAHEDIEHCLLILPLSVAICEI